MVINILLGIIILAMVLTLIVSIRDGVKVALENSMFMGLISVVVSMAIFVIAAPVIDALRDDGPEWYTTDEVVYNLAENSSVVLEGETMTFSSEAAGITSVIEVKGVKALDIISEGSGTVTIEKQRRDMGTSILPWGEVEDRTVVVMN